MGEEELLTVREVARRAHRSEETVRRWIWSGKLPAKKLGNQLFVAPADVEAVAGSRIGEPKVAYGARPDRKRRGKLSDLPFEPVQYDIAEALANLERCVEIGNKLFEKYGHYDLTEARRRIYEDYDN